MSSEQIFFSLLGSMLYNESTVEGLNYLKEQQIFEEIPYAAEQPLVLEGQGEVLRWLAGSSADMLADEAAADYMKLFIGVGKVLAPPWGSCYMTEERLIFQPQTLAVREFYARYGLKLKKKYSEPDDHIGLELEFLANLFEQGELETARSFAENHIKPWIALWQKDVAANAKTGLYRGLALMAVGSIEYLLNQA